MIQIIPSSASKANHSMEIESENDSRKINLSKKKIADNQSNNKNSDEDNQSGCS